MDTSTAHLVSWSEHTKGDVPPSLTGPSITISPLPAPHPPTVFLFGGKFVHNRKLTNEMWAMDLASRVWARVDAGQGPGPRYFHSMDTFEDKLVCFGGMSDTEPMSLHNDIWLFDCVTRKWLPQPSPNVGLGLSDSVQDPRLIPCARYAHLSSVSRGKLVISGGQHSDNSWVYEINVYDLRRRLWVSKTAQPEVQGLHSKGAYRSVAVSSKQRVISSKGGELKHTPAQSYSIAEEGEGGDIWCYSNYDFAKVRREMDLFTPIDDLPIDPPTSTKHTSPSSFGIHDQSNRMRGSSQPPGLRFPTGGIVGNHFILCGLYLASTSAAFSIWSLDLTTMVWRHLEPAVLSSGSWNRALIWPERGRIVIFGNTQYDLASDYGRRAVNLDNVAIISLETYGIYRPPLLEIPAKIQERGLTMLDESLASDFEVICDDGRKIKCSRQLLSERWPWFAEQEHALSNRLSGVVRDAPALDIADTLLGSFTPARLAPTSLTIPEPFPVCVALVQYFYTLSLSTPLQNRAPVLSALLFLAKQYKIDRLARLVIHALHERLEPSIAVGVYEIATLSGAQELGVRALNMIHGAKAASASRAHRQAPQPPLVTEAQSSSPAPNYVASASAPSTSQTSGGEPNMPRSTNEEGFRRARAESMTLVDEVAQEVDNLLAALAITANEATSTVSPTLSRASSPSLLHARIPRPMPRITPPPSSFRNHLTPELRTPDFTHRPSSPTSSEATSAYPATPSESIRESFILPPQTFPLDSRSSSSSSAGGLPPLWEDRHFLNRYASSSGSLLEKRLRSAATESAATITPAPPQSLSSYQAQVLSSHLTDPFARETREERQFSISATRAASSESSVSPRQDLKHVVPSSPASTELSLTLDEPSRAAVPSRVGSASALSPKPHLWAAAPGFISQASMVDTASIMTDSTGSSSKKAAKEEKRAIIAAEKAARKAESQAKFEALRSEQMQRMAIAKAEAQRRAETAKFETPEPKKPQPKSKVAVFGAKFRDAVLFPTDQGRGNVTTMF